MLRRVASRTRESRRLHIKRLCRVFNDLRLNHWVGVRAKNQFRFGLVLNSGPALVPIAAALEFEARASRRFLGEGLSYQRELPTGKPSAKPHGRKSAGKPARFPAALRSRSARPDRAGAGASGASSGSVIFGATVKHVVVINKSDAGE